MAMRRRFEVAFPNAAGIDVGAPSHDVAVPSDRVGEDEVVREFGCFTADLKALGDWLAACGVDTVAMESTGVYWIPLYEVLERRGFKVTLVNTRQVSNVPGRKSDVLDCQWLQQLMTYGLLSGAYRPADEVCVVRAVSRHRETLLQEQASQVQRMQKSLVQMNMQLTEVLSDVTGRTGQAIIRAIVGGERDPVQLATLRDGRVKANEAEIARALQGTWREEHLFVLGQALALFDAYQAQMAGCDAKLESLLQCLSRFEAVPAARRSKSHSKNAPKFDLRTELQRWCGVDLTRIDGIEVTTALKVLVEIGPDLSRFPTVKHFCSWVGVCPGTRITGGKRLSGKLKRTANRVKQALKVAAMSLAHSDSAMGAFYRRLCSRMDKARANTAAAHKLARMIYYMLSKGQDNVDKGALDFERRHQQRMLTSLKRRAAELGMQLIPNTAPVPGAQTM